MLCARTRSSTSALLAIRGCHVEAIRGLDAGGERVERLWINLGSAGDSFTVWTGDERRQVSDPERALVRITTDLEWWENYDEKPVFGKG